MGVSEFKSGCIQILKDLQRTQTALVITHRGQPLARIEPLGRAGRRRLGGLRHLGEIHGDLLDFDFEEWEMERDRG